MPGPKHRASRPVSILARTCARVRHSRSLRVLVVLLFCLPLTLMTSQAGAVAAVVKADTDPVPSQNFTFNIPTTNDAHPTCRVGLTLLDGTIKVKGGSWCEVVSPPVGNCDMFESEECSSIRLDFTNAAGVSLGGTVGFTPVDVAFYKNRAVLDEGSFPFGWTDVAQVCITVRSDGLPWGDPITGQSCADANLGSKIVTCPGVNILAAAHVGEPYERLTSGVANMGMWQKYEIRYSSDKPLFGYMITHGESRQGVGVRHNDTLFPPPETSPWPTTTPWPAGVRLMKGFEIAMPATAVQMDTTRKVETLRGEFRVSEQWYKPANADGLPADRVVGFGVAKLHAAYPFTSRAQTPEWQPNGGRAGKTDPGDCAWYWGEKLWTDGAPGEGLDEPVGPLQQPTPEEQPVEPPVDEPVPEDEPSFWGAILWILRQIWNAVKSVGSAIASLASAIAGLAGAIVDGITDAIQALFVPEDGFFEDQLDGLAEAADGTTLGNFWYGLTTGLSVPSATGCEGPAIDLNPFGADGPASHPLSACEAPMSSLASVSRLVLSISFGLFGGIACVRVLGRSIGWDPGLGNGGAS